MARRPLLAAVGVLPIIASFGMAWFFGWAGIVLGLLIQISRGLGDVLFLNALNERISSAFRATVISIAQLGTRASFALLGAPGGLWDRRVGIAVRPVWSVYRNWSRASIRLQALRAVLGSTSPAGIHGEIVPIRQVVNRLCDDTRLTGSLWRLAWFCGVRSSRTGRPHGRHSLDPSAGLNGVSRRISGRSRSTKTIENRTPSADKTDGNPQASIP